MKTLKSIDEARVNHRRVECDEKVKKSEEGMEEGDSNFQTQKNSLPVLWKGEESCHRKSET